MEQADKVNWQPRKNNQWKRLYTEYQEKYGDPTPRQVNELMSKTDVRKLASALQY